MRCFTLCLIGKEQREKCNESWELWLYRFKQGHKSSEVTKNICCAGADRCTITRLFKKFHSVFTDLDWPAISG